MVPVGGVASGASAGVHACSHEQRGVQSMSRGLLE